MAFTNSITSLITDQRGMALRDFITSKPEAWAREHMQKRYGHAPPQEDELIKEHGQLKSWFTEEGKLSILLQSKFLSTRLAAPIGDGIGWDFRSDGDPDSRMLHFKTTLMACERTAVTLPATERHAGSAHLVGLIKWAISAFETRAEIHNWRQGSLKGVAFDGENLAGRWVAFHSFMFVNSLGFDLHPDWLWGATQCQRIFGPVGEINPVSAGFPGQKAE
jgi:hypothetical protein